MLVARDRSSGAIFTAMIPSRNRGQVAAVAFHGLFAVLGEASAYRVIAKTKGIKVKNTPIKKSPSIYHINNVNAFDGRLKGWMFRFQGVTTKYLDNYLGWHRMLDKSGSRLSGKALLETSFA